MTDRDSGSAANGAKAPSPASLPQSISCKIIADSEELPRSSKGWTRARRCTLEVRSLGLHYLDRFVPYSDIEEAEIHIYQSAFFFEYGILSITHNGRKDHFGIKYDDFWRGELPFDVRRIEEETPFITYRRALIIIILVYLFWQAVAR